MRKFLFILLSTLLISFFSLGQPEPKIDTQDSVSLLSFVLNFEKLISKRETDELKKNSLHYVECISCINQKPPPYNYLIPFDIFINQIYGTFKKTILWECVKTEKPIINLVVLTGKDFKQRELKKEKTIIIYEVFYLTTKPNEIEPGHEGQQTGLQFIKLDGKFRFYGLTSVP